MAQEARHINISDLGEAPAWEHLIAEVRATKTPAIIRADGEDAVELRPIHPTSHRRPIAPPSPADDAVFWSAAGAWKDLVDGEQLKKDLATARGSDRPPVNL